MGIFLSFFFKEHGLLSPADEVACRKAFWNYKVMQ